MSLGNISSLSIINISANSTADCLTIELTIINLDDHYVRPWTRWSHDLDFKVLGQGFLINWPVSFYVCFNIIIWSFIFLLTKLMNNLFFNYINLFLPFPWLAIWPYFFSFRYSYLFQGRIYKGVILVPFFQKRIIVFRLFLIVY